MVFSAPLKSDVAYTIADRVYVPAAAFGSSTCNSYSPWLSCAFGSASKRTACVEQNGGVGGGGVGGGADEDLTQQVQLLLSRRCELVMSAVWTSHSCVLCSYAVHAASLVHRDRQFASVSLAPVWVVNDAEGGFTHESPGPPACPLTPPHERRQHPRWPFVSVGPK